MLTDRMLRAARLDIGLYEEVERDTDATGQALLVVVLAALAGGIAAFFSQGIGGLVLGVVVAIVGWAIWAALTYWIGTTFFGGTATWGELLRTIGFAQSPGVLYIFGFIPLLGGLIRLAVGIWILVAGIIAVRQALDFTTGKAVATVIIGWVVVLILTMILGALGLGVAILTS